MAESKILRILDNPLVYKIWQKAISYITFGKRGIAIFLSKELKVKAGTILDVGCGTGEHGDLFAERYTGIDYNSKYIDYAKKHHQGNYLVADSAEIERLNKKFDYVMCIQTTHHLSDKKLRETLIQMKNLARKKAYIIDAVYPPRWNILGNLLFKLDRGKYTRSYQEHDKILSEAGFRYQQDLTHQFPWRQVVHEYQVSA